MPNNKRILRNLPIGIAGAPQHRLAGTAGLTAKPLAAMLLALIAQGALAASSCGHVSGNTIISGQETATCTLASSENLTINQNAGITVSGADAVVVHLSSGTLLNHGSLDGQIGMHMLAYSFLSGGISNSGSINGSDSGIYLDGANEISGSINNSGSINGGSNGIYLNSASTIDSGLNNSGTISGGSNGIYLDGTGTINGGISNSGTISGGHYAIYADASATLDQITLSGANTARLVGDVYAPNTPLNISSGASFTASNAFDVKSVTVEQNATFYLGAMPKADAGNVTSGAGITVSDGVSNAGTMSLLSSGAAAITGSYTQTASGVLQINLSGSHYGQLQVDGTATLPSNARIDVNVANGGFSHASPLPGVLSASTLTSDGSFSVSDNSALFDFSASKNGNAVDLSYTLAAANGVQDAVQNNNNQAAQGAARVLDSIIMADSSGAIASKFMVLGSQQQVSDAVSQTLPLLAGGTAAAAQDALASINRVVQARVESALGLSSGDGIVTDRYLWLKPFGSWARQDSRDGVAGYRANTYGAVIGSDFAVSPALRLGAAFAYANSDVNSSTVYAQNARIDVYQLIGYGSYSMANGSNLSAQLDIGQNNNRGERAIAFAGSTASSRYDSQSAHLGVGAGRVYAVNERTDFSPSLRADYTWIHDRGHSETGADVLDLNVAAHNTEAMILGADGKVTYRQNDRTTLTANLGLGYDMLNQRSAITASYAGAPDAAFVTYGLKPSPWSLRGGMGTIYRASGGAEITTRYDAEYRTGFLNQTVSVKARWQF